MADLWHVTFSIYRKKGDHPGSFQDFPMEIDPEEYVLDGVEKAWAFHDRTLMFRHACHHSTCGACGMRVNDKEKLTCITKIRDVTTNGGKIKVEPLRNFPVVSDLVVDFGGFFQKLDAVDCRHVQPVDRQPDGKGIKPAKTGSEPGMERLVDCLECGLCVSACPSCATDEKYFGPAALASAQLKMVAENVSTIQLVDQQHGLWRCHSAYECTEVCPSFVEPGSRIMDLRRMTVSARLRHLFGGRE
jgi:succinate dehydrogenase / fumarate reductase iron-sulfur subunit